MINLFEKREAFLYEKAIKTDIYAVPEMCNRNICQDFDYDCDWIIKKKSDYDYDWL
jgi:CCR4-NOT transcriptional regulation complex NOT5 subunit